MRFLERVFQRERMDDIKPELAKLGTCEEKKSQWLKCLRPQVNNVHCGLRVRRGRGGDVDHG